MAKFRLTGVQNTAQVSQALREIAVLLEFSKAPKFKVRAYQRAAQVVSTVAELAPIIEQRGLSELEGIGPALSRQIEELWQTGRSQILERLRAEQPEGTSELSQVEGMTPKRLRALHDALGVRSVDALRGACAAERVQTVPGFGKKTEARLLAACDRWFGREEAAPSPVLLPRALERAARIEQRLREGEHRVELAGALRRGEETVSGLEFVVLSDARQALSRIASARQVLRVEPEAAMAHLSEGLRLELHEAEPANLGNALVLATGNQRHLDAVRALAATRGVTLAGFQPGESKADRSFASEAELYRALGVSCVPPELRSGTGELERAAASDFSDLVSLADIQGSVHCHTSYSDGKHTIAEMALAAHALGMKYITITDHSPSAHYASGVSLERLKAQWDEIAAVQEEVPIRILRGTESDILADGQLDYPEAVLAEFDVVIASIHARYRMDRRAMTERLKRALSLPVFKIWGHALGRILNHREAIDCDVLAVLDALAGSRGAIEVHADPPRLDLPPAWIPAARDRGIPFVISVDAHSTRGLQILPYGLTMARRGGLTRDEVLNTQSAERFAARVRPR